MNRVEQLINLIDDSNSTTPKYELVRQRRYLRVLCYPDGRIIFHGYYDENYSFYISRIEWCNDTDYSELIRKILFGDWETCLRYVDSYDVMGISADDKYIVYNLKYYYSDGQVTKYHGNTKFVQERTINDIRIVCKEINRDIEDVYTHSVQFDESKIKVLLEGYRETIIKSSVDTFEKEVVAIEDRLDSMQYLVFAGESIKQLYAECRYYCGQKYNEYMSTFH